MEWNKETQQWVIGGAVVIVVAVAGWWLFTDDRSQDTSTNTQGNTQRSNTSGSTSTSGDTRPTVDVNIGEEVRADDQPAGDRVRISEARLSRVSWLAVRDDMRIYGAARVNPAGQGQTFTDVEISLLKNTESGKTYKVVVYADDGDGVFDFKKDALVDALDDTFTATNGD